jgi:drug/metabolite transporter (DMT)-like permease
VILAMLLASVFLPLYAAAHRAAGRRSNPPWTPSALAGLAAAATALLVAYRIINQPGNDLTTTLKIGAPLGLLCLAAIGLGCGWAFQSEANYAEMRAAAAAADESAPGHTSDQPAS